jgi:hypothetical protein
MPRPNRAPESSCRAQQGQYSLQQFHDTFIGLGPLPLPLIRRAMLGDEGQLFPGTPAN